MFIWNEPAPTGIRLFWLRVGTVAGIVGWLCLLAAVVGAPIVAAIYHVLH